jgi:aspartyl-tRNA(Asn)/glutamyl-tRNA(Gln) amidotransferase subunit A
MNPFPSITAAAEQIAARKLSPVELAKACLARAKALDPVLHAFILLTEERALADATAAEARMMQNALKGKLDGIPIGHKDIYNTAGIATTAHSRLLEGYVSDADATTVAKLADAGTVMLGKLSTHEFAMGGPSFDLPWPPARNPWNPDHFTGGSSSGTGAATAAGIIFGGTGSDTGGSIRSPAAFCGIAGIKPTYGLCSRKGIQPLSFTLDHAGPLAWTVEDCALLLQAMAGYDPGDPASANRPVPDMTAYLGKGVAGLRIGVVRGWHEQEVPVSPATAKGIDDAAALFGKLGATVSNITLPSLRDFQVATFLIMAPEAFAIHEPWLTARFNDYGELLRDRLALGGMIRAVDYVQALRLRRELCLSVADAMTEFDVLLTAAQPGEAPRIDAVPKWALMERPGFTNPANVTGYPAMSICSGYGEGGLPVAIQLMAKPFQEALLLGAAEAYEAATPWRDTRPAIAAAEAA